MPEVNTEFPKIEDTPWKDLQFDFTGEWKPSIDGALVGPQNYTILQNLRYKDAGLEGVAGYSKINTTAITNHVKIRTGHHLCSEKTQGTYTLVHALDSSGQGEVYCNRTAIGSQGDFDTAAKFDTSGNPQREDVSTGLTGRFSAGPQGNCIYCNGEESLIFGGDEQRCAAIFSVDDNTGANPKDLTEKLTNEINSAAEEYTFNQADQAFLIIMTTRPIQALKYYVGSANGSASSQTVKYWNGTAWSADQVGSDGTKPGANTLAQTGVVAFSNHSDGNAKPMHFEELFLYAYLVELSAGSADVYHITVDYAFQSVKDVWDGVYRQPIQCQMYDSVGANFEDFTLQVNESSDLQVPIGLILNGLLDDADDYVYIMFEEPMAAIKWTMLGDMVNSTANTTMVVHYWDGDSWGAVSNMVDGTSGTVSLDQTGLVSWTAPTDEQPQTLFGSYGYCYKFYWDEDISGAKDSDPSTVVADLITGIPQQKTVRGFDWATLYQSRVMLGGYTRGDEGNRMDFSVANAPDAYNGYDSSDNGNQSLYFGGVAPIVAGTQLYNRFGANVFSMLLVLKETEVYLLVGDYPDEFTIYPVSLSIGCAAPQSLATAEVGLEIQEGMNRNAAMWISNSGPIMFDGAILSPIRGIEKYFDPNDSAFISWSYMNQARGWVDPIYKEYNILVPSGTGQTTNNLWLCYDLIRKKWFKKDPGTGAMPQCGFLVTASTGERRVYGGIDTGYMMYLENDTSFDGAMISQRIKTGDFFPTKNMWDITRIRKFKILMRKIVSSSSVNPLEVHYYGDTLESSGVGLVWDTDVDDWTGFQWEDWDDFEWYSAAASTFDLTANVGLQRLIKGNADMNEVGYAHAFEYRLDTDDIAKGFQPVSWGIRYRVERKDDTAS